MITKQLKPQNHLRRALVIGSPGIGKSVFGVFLLLKFMTERRDVAYHPLGDSKVYYFTWDATGSYQPSFTPHSGKTYEGFFDESEAIGAVAYDHFCHVYLFASPRRENFNHFRKEACFTVYLNPWSKTECGEFADKIRMEHQDEWLKRFNLVGGKPRFLFSRSESFESLVKRVEADIPGTVDEFKQDILLFTQSAFCDKMKHLIFSLYRDETLVSYPFVGYSSLAVEAKVSDLYDVGSIDEIRSWLTTTKPNFQSWREIEIERCLLQDLTTKKFCMQTLERSARSNEPTVQGSKVGDAEECGPIQAKIVTIRAVTEIKNDEVLYIPLSKTFPAIDAVLVVPGARRIIYVQATTSKAHPIQYQHLKDVYQDLTQRREFRGYSHILLFIVSNDIYDGFTSKPYRTKDRSMLKAALEIKVTQYVGKITGD